MRNVIVMGVLALAASAAQANDKQLVEATEESGTGFGSDVEALPDLNDDGVPEFAVVKDNVDLVSIRDGSTGEELFEFSPFEAGSGFAGNLRLVGDLDGDDVRDLYIATFGSGRNGSPPGFGHVVSLVTREPIIVCRGVQSTGFFGWSVADLGDVTSDGVPDLVIGEPGVFGVAGGNVSVYSGADGARLDDRAMFGSGRENLGISVCCMGDVDGDGVNDYAAGAPNSNGFQATFGESFRGSVRVRSGAADGFEFAIKGGARKFRNSSGDKVVVGEFFGFSVLGGDVDGDGRVDLVAAGRVNGGFVRALTAARRPKLVGQIFNPTGEGNIGDRLRLLPNADGRPGQEVITTGDNGVFVFSFGTKQPSVVAELKGEEGEFAGFTFAPMNDLGTDASNPLPDGTPDILLASTQTNRAFVIAMPTQTPQLPTKTVKQGAVFGKSATTIGTKASGKLKTLVKKGTAAFTFSFKKLPADSNYELFVETGPGSGEFDPVGTIDGASGKITLGATGGLPAEFGNGQFGSLGGRVVELRDGTGAVALSTVLPSPSAPPKAKLPVVLTPANGSPFPSAIAVSKLSVNSKTGKTAFTLKLKNVPKTEVLELWGETKPGSGEFAKIGDLNKGKIKIDAKGGIFFPNFPRVDIATLIKRILQVRNGLGVVVLSSPAQSSAELPDLRPLRASLDFVSFLDTFTVRTKVKNRGAADAGPVNLHALVTFQLDDVTVTRSLCARTNVDFPAGQIHDDLVIGNLDNPFAGQRPRVTVRVTVDPDSTGGSGEYVESNESNNEVEDSFAVDPNDNDDYDRD